MRTDTYRGQDTHTHSYRPTGRNKCGEIIVVNLLSLSSSRVFVVRIATKVSLTELDRESRAGRGRVERSFSRLLRPRDPEPGPLSIWRWEISFDLRFWSFSNVYNTKHTKMQLWRWCNKQCQAWNKRQTSVSHVQFLSSFFFFFWLILFVFLVLLPSGPFMNCVL